MIAKMIPELRKITEDLQKSGKDHQIGREDRLDKSRGLLEDQDLRRVVKELQMTGTEDLPKEKRDLQRNQIVVTRQATIIKDIAKIVDVKLKLAERRLILTIMICKEETHQIPQDPTLIYLLGLKLTQLQGHL